MKKHKPLSLPQRYQIESLRKTGLSQTPIASTLSVHKSTLCTELKSNTPTRGRTAGLYIGEHEQGKTHSRHLLKAKQGLLTGKLKKRIAKPLTKESEPCLSHETINRFGWQSIATIEITHHIKPFIKTQGILQEDKTKQCTGSHRGNYSKNRYRKSPRCR